MNTVLPANQVCECFAWCRSYMRKGYITTHHENCPLYNDSLIDVWEVTDGTVTCVFDNEKQARDCFEEDTRAGVEDLRIDQLKMHREVFENLGEFEGF